MENLNIEKQIEEMAKDLQKSEHWYFNDHSVDFELDRKKTAENLYNASYRKQEWISVEDRLPEESGEVLAYTTLKTYITLHYSAKHKLFNSYDDDSRSWAERYCVDVTHWMPLPEAPKMKGGAE